MDAATYHELARLEHATKARVYARHGMRTKAESHAQRAEYHASFGGWDDDLGLVDKAQEQSTKERMLQMREQRATQAASGGGVVKPQAQQWDDAFLRDADYEKDIARRMRRLPPSTLDDKAFDDDGVWNEPVRRSSSSTGPARIASRRVSAPRTHETDGDGVETTARNTPDTRMHMLPDTAASSKDPPGCILVQKTNRARMCRKQRDGDTQQPSVQCVYNNAKDTCVLDKSRIFCVLSDRRNACRRARGGDIVTAEDYSSCVLNRNKLCQLTPEARASLPRRTTRRHPRDNGEGVQKKNRAGSAPAQQRARAERAQKEAVCIAKEYDPVRPHFRATCRRETKRESESNTADVLERRAKCEQSEYTGRCVLRKYAAQREARSKRHYASGVRYEDDNVEVLDDDEEENVEVLDDDDDDLPEKLDAEDAETGPSNKDNEEEEGSPVKTARTRRAQHFVDDDDDDGEYDPKKIEENVRTDAELRAKRYREREQRKEENRRADEEEARRVDAEYDRINAEASHSAHYPDEIRHALRELGLETLPDKRTTKEAIRTLAKYNDERNNPSEEQKRMLKTNMHHWQRIREHLLPKVAF